MRIPLLSIFVALTLICSVSGSVSIYFQMGAVSQSDGTPVPVGSIGILVADTAGDGFSSGGALIGSSMSVGSAFGASDNLIVQTFTAQDIGGINGFNDTVNMTYAASAGAGNLFAGNNLEIYWFPSITSLSGTIPAGVSYGAYTNSTADAAAGSDIGFVAPSDGNSYYLYAYDNVNSPGSPATPADFSANFTTTTIPEPSSVVLLVAGGFLMTGALMRRRKVA